MHHLQRAPEPPEAANRKGGRRIEQLLRQDPSDEQLWALLSRARASLPGRDVAIPSTRARIQDQFPGGIPGELGYTIGRIVSGHADALFEIDSRRRMPEDQRRIESLIQTIGISAASERQLRRSAPTGGAGPSSLTTGWA